MSISSKVAIVFGILCWILFIVIVIQHLELRSYKSGIENLSEQVEMLETQADEMTQRFKDAQQQADQEMEKTQREGKEIMVAKVPAECDEAIKWAINEAKVFSA